MPQIYLTKENLVCNLFTGDSYYSTLVVSEAQFNQISAFPDYCAWQYDEQTDTFTLVSIMSETAIRSRRQTECFQLIDNKSKLWWDTFSTEEYDIIKNWYHEWLDAPVTRIIPELPNCLKNKLRSK
jgi:hypothetical protein